MKAFSCTLATVGGLAAVASGAAVYPRTHQSLRSLLARRDVTDADRCSVAAQVGGAFGGNCGVYNFCNDLFTGNVAFDPNFGFVANDVLIAADGFAVNGADGNNEQYSDGVANEGYNANDGSWAGLDSQIQGLLDTESNGGYLDGVMSGWLGFLGNMGFANSGFDSIYDGVVSYDPITGVSIDVSTIGDDAGAAVAEGTLAMYSAICLALQDCGEFSSSGSFQQCVEGATSACRESWIGDSTCDPECNTLEFFFDGGDCSAIAQSILAAADSTASSVDAADSTASAVDAAVAGVLASAPADSGCQSQWQGDGVCDMICNTAELGYDGGDCITANVEDAAAQVGQAVVGGLGALGSAVAGVANWMVENAAPVASEVGQLTSGVVEAAGQALNDAGQTVNDVVNVADQVANDVAQGANDVVNAVGDAVDAAGQAISNLANGA